MLAIGRLSGATALGFCIIMNPWYSECYKNACTALPHPPPLFLGISKTSRREVTSPLPARINFHRLFLITVEKTTKCLGGCSLR